MVDDLVVLDRVAVLEATGEVDDVQQQCRALDVAQELVAQALALCGALDEAGDVCHDEGAVVAVDHAQVGHQGGKGIVRDLGARSAHAGDEARLAHGGHADERGVCHKLHLELDPALVCRLAQLGEGRGAARRSDEVRVAAAAVSTLEGADALAVVGEVRDLLDGVHVLVQQADDRAHGHLEDEVLAMGAVTARTLAMRAALRLEMVLVAVVDQAGDGAVSLEDNGAAVAAVAAVRSALGDLCLASEGSTARTAVTGLDVDANLVCKLGHRESLSHLRKIASGLLYRREQGLVAHLEKRWSPRGLWGGTGSLPYVSGAASTACNWQNR